MKAILNFFCYASVMLQYSGPAVVDFLGSSGDIVSLVLLCFFDWHLGLGRWQYWVLPSPLVFVGWVIYSTGLLPFVVLKSLLVVCSLVGNSSGNPTRCDHWGFHVKCVSRYLALRLMSGVTEGGAWGYPKEEGRLNVLLVSAYFPGNGGGAWGKVVLV